MAEKTLTVSSSKTIPTIRKKPLPNKPLFSGGFLPSLIISNFSAMKKDALHQNLTLGYFSSMKATARSFQLFLLLLLVTSGMSCKKIIDVNLNDAAPQLVVEGNIYSTPGPYYIQISKTVNYSSNNQFPPVSGARVVIRDVTANLSDTLIEIQQGRYATRLLSGVAGRTYQLQIVAEGKNYTASSTIPSPVLLDSVSFEKISRPGGKTDWFAVINYQDPAGISNYYLFTLLVNGRRINNTFVYDDRFSDGRYVSRTLRTDSTYINPGDSVTVTMQHMGKEGFDYYSTFAQVTGNGALQTISPANPISNISNGALGYFLATHTNTRKRVAR
jgi:hypothetical protein